MLENSNAHASPYNSEYYSESEKGQVQLQI